MFRRIEAPGLNPVAALDDCIKDIKQTSLKGRVSAERAKILAQFSSYERRASAHTLFKFDDVPRGNRDRLITGEVTKGDLSRLYSQRLRRKGSLARPHYDFQKSLAPRGKCPFCGFGHASALDHFLPKSRYPTFSVLLKNLNPICADCNRLKCDEVVSENAQLLHPMFEAGHIETERWLFASVVESDPAVVFYEAAPPTSWDAALRKRVRTHFEKLELARRYGVEAASELINVCQDLRRLQDNDDKRRHLQDRFQSDRRVNPNAWRTAMYDALIKSEWFIDKGCLLHY